MSIIFLKNNKENGGSLLGNGCCGAGRRTKRAIFYFLKLGADRDR